MSSLFVSTRKGLFECDGTALTVDRTHFVGVPVSTVLVDERDGSIYAALDHGHFGVKIHRSDDGGGSWTELDAPAYPPKPDGVDDRCPIRGTPRPWNTEMVWTLSAGHADNPGELWAGTIPGGLFRSTDRGESWQLNDALWYEPSRAEWMGGGYDYPGIHSVLVDPRDANHIVVGISCGGIWRSEDGGATWQVGTGMRAAFMPDDLADKPEIQDPHRLAMCTADPDVMWAQHHSGMYRSTTGGRTWDEIHDVAPSTFGFAVAAHPTDPGTAWFVPAVSDEVRIPVDGRVVVTKTTDGGKSFRTCDAGLPAEHAYDLAYRHALDVDATGEHVAFGSTTGSLWVSRDGGESFATLSTSLPPIFAVQFA